MKDDPDLESNIIRVDLEDVLFLEGRIEEMLNAIDAERANLASMLSACRIMRQVKRKRPKVEPIRSPTGLRSKCSELAKNGK